MYVYDLKELRLGVVEKYKLAPAIGGQSFFIDNSKYSNRMSFIQNFSMLAVVPYPHLNTINCIGMGPKDKYVIWRQKNGFFTALDKRSNLRTWSLLTGKLLYNEKQ